MDSIKRLDSPLQYYERCEAANDIFSRNYNLQGIVVLKGKKPIGLIMRNKFYYQMEKMRDSKSFLSRPIKYVMDYNPLILDYSVAIKDASNIAMSREESRVYDYIIITKENEYQGVVPIAYLLNSLSNS